VSTHLLSSRGRLNRHAAVRYAVAEQIGFSQRRFIELFRNEVGLTPKAFSRVCRFQHVLGQVEHLTDVEFAGVSPTMYLRYRESRNHIAVHD
jgi:methylphosphotriester-DNA--protein-cysteine methyltransferase